MKLIDVIIPAYNSHETIKRTLYSICYQDISENINVYIVNDCSELDYSEEVEYFSKFIDIVEINLEKNEGPGIARDVGIRNSNSKYITFIDSDDIFSSPIALKTLLNNIEESESDLVIGGFCEDCVSHIFTHFEDTIWLHGKIYRRQFLEKNNISFNRNCSYSNEDEGFNKLILLCNPKVKYINDIIYFWCYNSKSITRKNNHEYIIEGECVCGYIENIIYALKEGINRNLDNEVMIAELAMSTMYDAYYYYLESHNKEILKVTQELKKIFLKYPITDSYKKDEIAIKQLLRFLNYSWNKKNLYSMKYSFEDFLELVEKYK